MEPIVQHQSYGKSRVRMSRITRGQVRHEFIELTCWIELGGDFDAAYDSADNCRVVATDSMKNTVYVLAQRHGVTSVEQFARLLAGHFLQTYSHVDVAEVRCEETLWCRIEHDGRPHPHAFSGGNSERNTCEVLATRDEVTMHSGLMGLVLLKTTGSGFSNFLRDEYTTLPETDDRIFATSLEASWPCRELSHDWTAARTKVRDSIVGVFAGKYSRSVQHTLYEMAKTAFAACEAIDEITITMPNRHHLPFNFAPFGLSQPNEVFVPTDEPHGNISATITRD